MSTSTSSPGQEGFLSEGNLKQVGVESVFAPLTRLSHSKSEQTAMQPPKHIIIYLLDHQGCILGRRCLPNTLYVIELESFRAYGACRVEVLRATYAGLSEDSTEWTLYSAHKRKNEDFGIAGCVQ